MSEKKYMALDFTHDEINNCINKIKKGMVLTPEEYKKLIKDIGLNNISTFNGDYNSLRNLPELPKKLSDLENDINFEGLTEGDILGLIEKGVEAKADKEDIENLKDMMAADNKDMQAELDKKVDAMPGYALMLDAEAKRLSQVFNYDDSAMKENINELAVRIDEKGEGIKEVADKLDQVDSAINGKVDKKEGFALMAEVEMKRLAEIFNYDDTEVQAALRNKVDNEVIEILQTEINELNREVANKAEAKEGCSVMPNEEIERLAKVFNYDDAEVRGLLLDDEPYEFDMANKHYVFACGHTVFAEANADGELVITFGTNPDGKHQIVVPQNLVAKTIIVGGFGVKNINKSRHLASTYVHVRNAELLAVHGGNFFEGSVGKSVVIVENSKVKEIIGGGDAGKQLEKRGAFKNVVGETEVRLDGVTGCSLCYGGGGGHCSVGKARVYANNSNVSYIFPCGANGLTLDGELYLNSGIYNYASQVNRGVVVNSKIFLNDGVVKNFYFGGETEDTTVDGVLHTGLIVLNGGVINNFRNGTSNGVELKEIDGFIRDTSVTNGDVSQLEVLKDRPADPKAGDFMFDITLNKPIFFNGSYWVDSLGFIVG